MFGAKVWNSIEESLKSKSLTCFKIRLKESLISNYWLAHWCTIFFFFCVCISPCLLLFVCASVCVNGKSCPLFYNSGTRELTLKCKFKCYLKPMNNPLGVSPSKGKQGTTRGKEKIFDLGGNRTHDLRIRSTVTPPTELQGRTEKVGDDLGSIVLC